MIKKIKIILAICGVFFFSAINAIEYDTTIIVGAERTELYLSKLINKKVAILTNHTGLIKQTHIVDSLLSLKINIVKIFSPEHGFRGKADAGEKVSSNIDLKTNLPIVSLYGSHKKPTAEDLEGIDILVYDIQDVGVRFYTYISTLQYAMEACSENNIDVLILDRPNPNGFYVDGPVLKPKYKSFIGMQPIPIVYGMTVGEYGKMINTEGWLKDSVKCNLDIIKCKNYTHKLFYKLPVKPSPNLPNMISVFYYPTLCLFEGTVMSVGRGTDAPFQVIGHPDLKGGYMEFTPKSMIGAKKPKLEGVVCKGYDARDNGIDYIIGKKGIGIPCLVKAYAEMTNKDNYFTKSFNILAGNAELKEQIKFRMNEEEIKASWKSDLDNFKIIRTKYLLYEDFE